MNHAVFVCCVNCYVYPRLHGCTRHHVPGGGQLSKLGKKKGLYSSILVAPLSPARQASQSAPRQDADGGRRGPAGRTRR